MGMKRWRQGCVLLLALLLIFGFPASAGERDLPVWLWFMRFDGTPNAVRARFNQLAQHKADQGQFAEWAAPPSANNAMATGGDHFVFFDDDAAKPIVAGPVSYRLSGRMDAKGAVAELSIEVGVNGVFSREYLTGCDQLAQICASSLLGELDERTQRNLYLSLLYDLRPFNFTDQEPLAERTRTLSTAIDERLVTMQWTVEPDDAMRFTIALGGNATAEDTERARLNNRCNRLLSQSSDECSTLAACLEQMKDQLQAGNLDWPDLAADLAQAVESAAVIAELQMELSGYEKACAYAGQLGVGLPELNASLTMVEAAIAKSDANVLSIALDEAIDEAKQARKLIGIVREQ